VEQLCEKKLYKQLKEERHIEINENFIASAGWFTYLLYYNFTEL